MTQDPRRRPGEVIGYASSEIPRETPRQHFADRLSSVGHAVHVLLAVAYDLVRVRPGSKSHPWVGSQHIAFGGGT